jgi:hypothetical protein
MTVLHRFIAQFDQQAVKEIHGAVFVPDALASIKNFTGINVVIEISHVVTYLPQFGLTK